MMKLSPYGRRQLNLASFFDEIENNLSAPNFGIDNRFRCDIADKQDHFLLTAEIPGFEKEDIHLDIEGEILSISANNSSEKEEIAQDGGVIRRERRFGSFKRSFDISDIDVDGIEAAYTNGILSLKLPKSKEIPAATRKIEIA